MVGFEGFNGTDFNGTLDCYWCDENPDFDALIRLQEYSIKVELSSAVLVTVLAPITVTANTLLLGTFWKSTSSYFRSPTMYFIIFLSVTDLIIGLLVEPIKAFCSLDFYLRNRKRSDLCLTLTERVVDVVLPATANASFLIVLALSLSQYLAVAFPCRFGGLVTVKTVRISVGVAWGYSLAFSMLQLLWRKENSFTKALHMYDLYGHSIAISSALICLYILMLKALNRQIRNRNRTSFLKTRDRRSCSVTQNNSHPQKTKATPRMRVMEIQFIKMNILLIIILLLCTLPTIVVKYIVEVSKLKRQNGSSSLAEIRMRIIEKIADDVLLVKFMLDAFVYVWRLPRYRKALLNTISACSCC